MAETTYILGAGVNRCLKDRDGLRPPLTQDFFQMALRHGRLGRKFYLDDLEPLFVFIKRFWHRSLEHLRDEPFDLEECYTLIQLQRLDAELRDDRNDVVELIRIENLLTTYFAEYLYHFRDSQSHQTPLFDLARSIQRDPSVVITFNYDTLLEEALESASGVNPSHPELLGQDDDIPDEDLSYSHFNWNRPRAYGVEFDEVQIHRAGLSALVTGERFYQHPGNELYQPPLLKLHGSTNWFVHSGVMMHESMPPSKSRRGQTLVYRAPQSINLPAMLDGELLRPIIVTPVLNKRLLDLPMLTSVWEIAKSELRSCERLVVIGYSFPPTDFHVRRLFREAFADRPPRELSVVNPDTSVIRIAKDLCNFNSPVVASRDLEEFLS